MWEVREGDGEQRGVGLTYCHASEEFFHEFFVRGEVLEDFIVCGQVDEDCEGILGYLLD